MKKPRQATFAESGFERHRKVTRREKFLAEMDQVVPWKELCAVVEPHYPKNDGGRGRPTVGLERMLRIYFLQHWFNLSDPAVEESLYDSASMRSFVDIDLGREAAPDETTVCRFRHLLEKHGLGGQIFEATRRHLQGRGLVVAHGTIVDATIIDAPSSTKNADRARDPEMRQTKKGNQWYFGMKAHIGVDSRNKTIHTVAATAANVADCRVLPQLLHGKEKRVWGDQAYQGQGEVIRAHAPNAPVTRATDNQLVWKWDNTEPFGHSAPDENPNGLGIFAYNLRFPGQYYDAETGAHYNYMRDFDPATGRYLQSDPIGLRGGLSTYGYVSGNPLKLGDPLGLCSKPPLPPPWKCDVICTGLPGHPLVACVRIECRGSGCKTTNFSLAEHFGRSYLVGKWTCSEFDQRERDERWMRALPFDDVI